MIDYLIEEEIIETNRLCLKISDEGKKFYVMQPDDIRFILRFVENDFGQDYL